MSVQREPGSNRAVVALVEVGHRTLDAGLGPVRVRGPDEPLHAGGAHADEVRRSQRVGAGVPRGHVRPQLDHAAVHGAHAAHPLGGTPGQFDDDVAAPGLSCDHRAVQALVLDHGEQIVGDRGEVVAVIGLVRLAVTTQINGNGTKACVGQLRCNAIPETCVGGEAVDEEECRAIGLTGVDWRPMQRAQRYAVRHLDPLLLRPNHPPSVRALDKVSPHMRGESPVRMRCG